MPPTDEPKLVTSDDEASFRPGPLPKKPVTQGGKLAAVQAAALEAVVCRWAISRALKPTIRPWIAPIRATWRWTTNRAG